MQQQQSTPAPHDATFRQFLTDPRVARDFIELHLPAELQEMCDLGSLKLEQGSFVDEDLRTCFTDVLYSLKTSVGEGYIQVLIEHQSTPDRHMAFRLMRYAVAAMQRHLDAGHQFLPLVIPILFYAGQRIKYPYSTNWLDEFKQPQQAKQFYSHAFPLVDVTIIPDDEIMYHRRVAALTLLMKHARERDLLTILDKVIKTILNGDLSPGQFKMLINYMVITGKSASAQDVLTELKRQLPQRGDEMMTLAEQFELDGYEKGIEKGIEQGIEQGLEKGLEQGIERGREERNIEIARLMLEAGQDRTTVMKITGLSAARLDKIVRLSGL